MVALVVMRVVVAGFGYSVSFGGFEDGFFGFEDEDTVREGVFGSFVLFGRGREVSGFVEGDRYFEDVGFDDEL